MRLLVLLVLVLGCSERPALVIDSFRLQPSRVFAGDEDIVGVLRNDSAEPARDVILWFSLLDVRGDSVGAAMADVAYIGPGGSAPFSAWIHEDSIYTVVPSRVTYHDGKGGHRQQLF